MLATVLVQDLRTCTVPDINFKLVGHGEVGRVIPGPFGKVRAAVIP